MAFFGSFHGIGEGQDFFGISVIDTAEFFSGSDRPVDRAGRDPEFFFDIV